MLLSDCSLLNIWLDIAATAAYNLDSLTVIWMSAGWGVLVTDVASVPDRMSQPCNVWKMAVGKNCQIIVLKVLENSVRVFKKAILIT